MEALLQAIVRYGVRFVLLSIIMVIGLKLGKFLIAK